MSEAYEIEDSYLVEIEHHAGTVTLRMDASKQVWPEGFGIGVGGGWAQPIELTIEGATIDSEFTSYPVELVDGEVKIAHPKANPEDIALGLIPASLTGSGPVELRLEGMEEDSNVLKIATIRGHSAAITWTGEAEFVESLGEEE